MPVLQVITASTRPGRIGPAFAAWFLDHARAHGVFEVEDVDLARVNLPFMDEPEHPRLGRYIHDHTRSWSARVARADAFVVVTPEYNYGLTAPLKNAIDFLHNEWKHAPVGFVSYGGVSAGTRGVQMAKQVMTTLSMVPLSEAVAVPMFPQFIDDQGRVRANQVMDEAAVAMLDALTRWVDVLAPLRRPA